MKLKSIFKKTPVIKPEVKETASQIKPEVPEGLLKRCNKCGKGIFTEDYKKNLYICPKCGGYLRMPAQKRIEFLTEADSFEEWDTGLSTENPLHMVVSLWQGWVKVLVKRLQEVWNVRQKKNFLLLFLPVLAEQECRKE